MGRAGLAPELEALDSSTCSVTRKRTDKNGQVPVGRLLLGGWEIAKFEGLPATGGRKFER